MQAQTGGRRSSGHVPDAGIQRPRRWGWSMVPHLPGGQSRSLAMTLASTRVPAPSQLTCSHPGPGSTNISLCLLRVPLPRGFILGPPIILITRSSIRQELLAPPGQHFWKDTSHEGLWHVLCWFPMTDREGQLCPRCRSRAQLPMARGRNRDVL